MSNLARVQLTRDFDGYQERVVQKARLCAVGMGVGFKLHRLQGRLHIAHLDQGFTIFSG
jgi:hypothetical protein